MSEPLMPLPFGGGYLLPPKPPPSRMVPVCTACYAVAVGGRPIYRPDTTEETCDLCGCTTVSGLRARKAANYKESK